MDWPSRIFACFLSLWPFFVLFDSRRFAHMPSPPLFGQSSPGRPLPDPRPLPSGWVKHFHEQTNNWYYVDLDVKPPTVSYIHPADHGSASERLTSASRAIVAPVVTASIEGSIRQTTPRTFAQQLYASAVSEPSAKSLAANGRMARASGSKYAGEVDLSPSNNHEQDPVRHPVPQYTVRTWLPSPNHRTSPDVISSAYLYSHAMPNQLARNRQTVLPTCTNASELDGAEKVLSPTSMLNSSQSQRATGWEVQSQRDIAPTLGVLKNGINHISTTANGDNNPPKGRSTLKKKPPRSHYLKNQQFSAGTMDRAYITAWYPSVATGDVCNPHTTFSSEPEVLYQSPPSHGNAYCIANPPLVAAMPQVKFPDVSTTTPQRPLAVTSGMMINLDTRMALVHDHNQQSHGGHHAVSHSDQNHGNNEDFENIGITFGTSTTTEALLVSENVVSGSIGIATVNYCPPYMSPYNGEGDAANTSAPNAPPAYSHCENPPSTQIRDRK